jgi:hypothetical protein
MRLTFSSLAVGLFAVLAGSAPAWAQAGGPELKTDDPYYPGEGALSTPPRVLSHAFSVPRGTMGASTNREKMIRLFLWRAEHYGHQVSPEVYNLPGTVANSTPDPSSDNPLLTDYDAMRAMFSYGFGVCGTNHAQMRVFTDEAGWPCRRRGLNGDTGFEVQVDANVPPGATGWRYYNTDQYTLHFLSNDPSAHFASVDEVITTAHRYIEWNPDLGFGYRLPQANTHGNYQDFAGVTGTVADRSLQWRDYYQNVWNLAPASAVPLYGEGYTSTPVVVHLKRGETFTRWANASGAVTDLGLAGKLWWGYNTGDAGAGDNSPFVKYSFVQNAPARDQVGPAGANPEASALLGQSYGNGCFLWVPDLSQNEHLDGALSVTGTLAAGGSPALKSTGGSTLVLFHNAPYTIAGRPSDGKDPANSGAADGAVIGADTVGSIGVEVSTNAGAMWASIGSLSGAGARIDFTDSVKGRNQYLLRLTFADGQGLSALSLRTVTMMSQGVYPNLKSGTAQVTYASANTGALELSPDLFSATSANSGSGYVQKVADSGNATGVFYSGSTVAYSATDNNPLSVTYKITVPPQLASSGATFKQIFAAADALVRVTPDGGPYTKIEISPNQSSWTLIGQYNPPADDQLSSYWAYGRSADGSSLGGTTYYVRYTTSNGPHQANLRYLRLSATYSLAASASPVHVTYFWNNGSNQTLDHMVAAGSSSDAWSIATGTGVTQQKVALSIPSGAATAVAPTIATQPVNQTVTAGQTATFSVAASGTAPLSYQWQKNGANIAGATGASYTTPATTLTDNNSTFRVTVTNSAGSAVSNTALLTVNPGSGGPAPSTTVTLQDGSGGYSGETDTYLDKYDNADGTGVGNTVEGNKQYLEIRWYPSDGSAEDMVTLIRFDLSSIPSNATITSAQLQLYNLRAAANNSSSVITLSQVSSAWTDRWTWTMGVPTAVATGVTCPSTVGYSGAPATPESYLITGLGPLVQGWVSNSASNQGLMLSTSTDLNFRVASSRYPTAQYRPALQVTYTTGPGGPTTPPTVSVDALPPSSGFSPISLTGTTSASGSATITQVTWLNAATGNSGTASGTTTWAASIPLADGDNQITITATDSTGTSGSSTFTVTYTPPPPGSGGGKGHKTCGLGLAGDAPVAFPLAALAVAALLLWGTRRGSS